MGSPRPPIGWGGHGIRVVPAGRRHPHHPVALHGLHRARLGGPRTAGPDRGRDRDPAGGHRAVLRRLHRRRRGGVSHQPRGREGARGEPAGAAPTRRADARGPPMGVAVRPRGRRVRLPQGAAHPSDPDDRRDGAAEPRPAAAGAGHGRGAQRPARDRRRCRADAPRDGARRPHRPRPDPGRVARRRDLGKRAREAALGAVARAALRRARVVRFVLRRGSARVRRARREGGIRRRVGARRPARPGRADPSARRDQLLHVGHRRHGRAVLRHGRRARQQRHQRRRRDAVHDQRRGGRRVLAGLLLRARLRPPHRRGGRQRPHRDPRPRPGHARVGDAGALPARRRDPACSSCRRRRRDGEAVDAADTPTGPPADPTPEHEPWWIDAGRS